MSQWRQPVVQPQSDFLHRSAVAAGLGDKPMDAPSEGAGCMCVCINYRHIITNVTERAGKYPQLWQPYYRPLLMKLVQHPMSPHIEAQPERASRTPSSSGIYRWCFLFGPRLWVQRGKALGSLLTEVSYIPAPYHRRCPLNRFCSENKL